MPGHLRLGHADHDGWPAIRAKCVGLALLFITDGCPVGCAHCSVDSRRDSPTITDYELFEEIVDWLCCEPGLEVVGISGGEPFDCMAGLPFGKLACLFQACDAGGRARP